MSSVPKDTPEYEELIRSLPLPETKKEKILYFLWIDDQVMDLWAQYLELKGYTYMTNEITNKNAQLAAEKLKLIEHYEQYMDALKLHITYKEIDTWATANSHYKRYIYNRF